VDETVNVRQAKAQFSRLVARAGLGDVITITKRGTRVATLTALPDQPMTPPEREVHRSDKKGRA
jgi:prevent-host-death family protein